MAISVIVRSGGASDACLTFDAMQRVVIGRGANSDVRLPDASVSHRHACLGTRGADVVLVDEGSTNGTFVGQVRVAPHTSRVVRSGDTVRVGRVWLELRIDPSPITRDLAAATRDIALALVSKAMSARGKDLVAKIRVAEGPDQGSVLALADEGRAYVFGRGAHCDLALSDGDASREHAHIVCQRNVVRVRDLGTKNGTWLGESRVPDQHDVLWRPALMMRIGRTVLALEEPVGDALARIECAPDEVLAVADSVEQPAPDPTASAGQGRTIPQNGLPGGRELSIAAPMIPVLASITAATAKRAGFSITDRVVMATAICVLALSIAGLVWLLHG